MAKPILVANWKNNPGSLDEAAALLRRLSKNRRFYQKLSFFIAPPLPYFESVIEKAGGFARLASQDIFFPPRSGAYTGKVTPDILKSFGVRIAILGHSENRALGETDEEVSKKVRFSIRAGIAPLVCIGEPSQDKDGEHFEFLRGQLRASLAGLKKRSDAVKLVIAYEPVWAVGSGAAGSMEPAELAQSVIFIKKVLSDMYDRATAERIAILYGGSVDPVNAGALLRQTKIRGLLIGRASLNAKSLEAVAKSFLTK